MAKYRLLTQEELSQLQGVFINFLAANSITANDWEKIKTKNKDKMNSLIEQFSDVVFEKTLANVHLLEKRLPGKLLMYELFEDKMVLLGLEVIGDSPLDFTNEFSISELSDLFINENLEISFIIGTKPLFEDKKKEIFDLMESGAMISRNEELFSALKKLKESYSPSEN